MEDLLCLVSMASIGIILIIIYNEEYHDRYFMIDKNVKLVYNNASINGGIVL